MKKIYFAAIISLVTVLCISATVAETNVPENCSSSVTVNIAGVGEGIDFDRCNNQACPNSRWHCSEVLV